MTLPELYPIKFEPILKEKIWGGQKLKTHLNKNVGHLDNCGESWELSGVTGNVSTVANGALIGKNLNDLIELYTHELLGNEVIALYGHEFPLLIKFIDAAADLSVQVHPDDKLARARHGSFGKTEMWYVMQADEGATLISGFNREMSREHFSEEFNAGRLEDIMNKEEVEAGDVFFIPAGRIHTIGKGLVIAEIQQTSDVTYRIYDFDRVDKHGNKRELHIEESLDAMDYSFYDEYKTSYSVTKNKTNNVIATPFFVTNKISLDKPITLQKSDSNSFRIFICTEGKGMIEGEAIQKGEVVLMPASFQSINLTPDGKMELLETYIDGTVQK